MGKGSVPQLTYIKPFSVLGMLSRFSGSVVGILLCAGGFIAHAADPSDAAAFEQVRREAAQGSVEHMYELGNLYVFGIGVPKDEADPDQRAAQFYFEAARRGHAGAQHALGILYLTGKGVQQDAGEAQKWFGRAAAQGHAASRAFVNAPRK